PRKAGFRCSETSSLTTEQTAPEPVHEKKEAAVQFLKSLESKDSEALKYVDPDKYTQHKLHAEDGLPVVRKDGVWGFCALVRPLVVASTVWRQFEDVRSPTGGFSIASSAPSRVPAR
ncbi:MAG TPA: hypothetical protein VII08_19170, partial [Myxococcales bacterium]